MVAQIRGGGGRGDVRCSAGGVRPIRVWLQAKGGWCDVV